MRRPYGFISFYAPVVIGITINWILFFFIARVVLSVSMTTNATMAKEKISDVKLRAVSTKLLMTRKIETRVYKSSSNVCKIVMV